MDCSWVEAVDTAIKIGFGAVVAGISGYVVLIKNQSHELEKDHRARYFALQEEKENKVCGVLGSIPNLDPNPHRQNGQLRV